MVYNYSYNYRSHKNLLDPVSNVFSFVSTTNDDNPLSDKNQKESPGTNPMKYILSEIYKTKFINLL